MSNAYKDWLEEKKRMSDYILKIAGYVCDECASDMQWTWPENHCATIHKGTCDACGQKRWLSCWNDWLRPGETEIKPENWD